MEQILRVNTSIKHRIEIFIHNRYLFQPQISVKFHPILSVGHSVPTSIVEIPSDAALQAILHGKECLCKLHLQLVQLSEPKGHSALLLPGAIPGALPTSAIHNSAHRVFSLAGSWQSTNSNRIYIHPNHLCCIPFPYSCLGETILSHQKKKPQQISYCT